MITLKELMLIKPEDFKKEVILIDEILSWFSLLDASWIHSGDPKDPHAELTSGWCSNGFFDCLRVLKYINLSDILADQLGKKIRKIIDYTKVDWVIGSPMAGITFAHDVARAIDAPINMCVEKDPADPKGKRMMWKRMAIPEGDWVLQIEELTTTAHTLNEVERAIREGNPNPVNFLPYVGILVHRPPKLPVDYYDQRIVVALIEKEIWAVPPEECPLCKQGSKRLRPKTNWKELTGKN
ncbi:MAG: hypothetical protein ABIJ85_01590 [bacterium]